MSGAIAIAACAGGTAPGEDQAAGATTSGPHLPGRNDRSPPRDVLVAEESVKAAATLCEAVRSVFPGALLHLAGAPAKASLMLSTLGPDFVVVNLNFVAPSPRDFIAQAQARDPRTPVVVVAGHGDDDRLLPALQCGAAGFLLKHDPLTVIESHLRDAHAGALTMSPPLARQLIRYADRSGPGVTLERHEVELLTWVAAGDTLQEAAWRMHIELAVVSVYVQRIYRKVRLPGSDMAPPAARPLHPDAQP